MPQPEFYMARCFDLALKGKGLTAPNPMVGAVLVHNGRTISEGYHHFHGGDHAEVDCLKNLPPGDEALLPGSTLYVNLEPCAHHGHTPPCALRIIDAHIPAVVIANADPNPLVAGKGIHLLQQAGVDVKTGVCSEEGLWLNRRFFCFHTRKRPYIVLKWAQDEHQHFAPADGSRLQLTGPAAQTLVHQWRTEESAILVGARTAQSDNPQLTARLVSGRQPLRIALDRTLNIPASHHLLDRSVPTWIINEKLDAREHNLHYVQIIFGPGLLPELLHKLYEAKIISLIIEGGAALLQSFIQEGLWDEARIFTSPLSIAGGLSAPRISGADRLWSQPVGDDLLEYYIAHHNPYPFQPDQGL